VLEKTGTWYSFESERIGQGRENAKEFLKDNPEIARRVEDRIRDKCGLIKPSASPAFPGSPGSMEGK
jgi:recombination protein RecA